MDDGGRVDDTTTDSFIDGGPPQTEGVVLPRAFRVLQHELSSMAIDLRLDLAGPRRDLDFVVSAAIPEGGPGDEDDSSGSDDFDADVDADEADDGADDGADADDADADVDGGDGGRYED